MNRVCNCGNIEFFVKFPSKGNVCQPCVNEKQKAYRKSNRNRSTVKYEKTKKGFLMRAYRNMKSRVEGVQKEKQHLYKGLFLLNKEDFYSWALRDRAFNVLFSLWSCHDYDKRFTPSVERINSKRGYSMDNIEWITHKENSRRGLKSRYE